MYKRRLKILLGLMVVGVAVVVGRLAQLQLVQGAEHRRRAEQMLTYVDILPTVRGHILDRKNRVLACDEPCFDLCLDYRLLTADENAYDLSLEYRHLLPANKWVRRRIDRLAGGEKTSARHVEMFRQRVERTWWLVEKITRATRNETARTAENVVRRVEAIRRIVGGPVRLEMLSHPIISGLDEEAAVQLRAYLAQMVGASVRPSHRRWYPFGEAACHVIGFLGPVRRDQLARARSDGELPLEQRLSEYVGGDLAGKSGVERLCEELPAAVDPGQDAQAESGPLLRPPGLRGRRGYRRIHQATGTVKEVAARRGWDVQLTIDIELQRVLAAEFQRRLGQVPARAGAIVVIDVPTGEVLAMVSLPTFDLNEYRKQFPRLAADTVDLPLWDRTVSVRYPPGSTFKPLGALAALSTGEISPSTTFHCRGYMHTPGEFSCWKKDGHGSLELVEAIQRSCNVFFYHLGEHLGLRRHCRWLTELGLADVPGTGLPQERRGLLPDPRRSRYAGEARLLAIGQGKVLTTPMHVANAMAAVARRGEFRTPLLVREVRDRQQAKKLKYTQQVRKLAVSPDHVALVREAMYKAVNTAAGTGYSAYDPQIAICGKTGTATTEPRRVDSNGNGRIDRTDRIVRSGDTLWFAGFAPYRDPRIAFAVLVEYAEGGGGRVCGPIAGEVVRICREFGYL